MSLTTPTTNTETRATSTFGGPQVRRVIKSRHRNVWLRTGIALLLALATTLFFLLYDSGDAWALIAELRIRRLLGLIVVAVALSCSTVIFQVVTRNRILSPGVMGFDAMFALVATAVVFFLTGQVAARIPQAVMFGIQTTAMMLLAVSLFMFVLTRNHNSVHLLVLMGIVTGAFLRSLTSMMVVIMDPGEYLHVQGMSIASFSKINEAALWVTIATTIVALVVMMWRAPVWDLLAIGPDTATALGVHYRREVRFALAVSSILVACATALVGPLVFFGLLIVNITVFAIGSTNVRHLIPASGAIGVVVLVGGQGFLEHVLNRGTVLPVVIELVGGILLLVMIVKEGRRK